MDADSKKPVSFSFSSNRKGDGVKLGSSKLRDEAVQERLEERDFVRTLEDKKIKGQVFVYSPKKNSCVILIVESSIIVET